MSEDFQHRTRETHSYHCASLTGTSADINSTTFGTVWNSILNTSHYFHVVEGMCPDIMHDILEGCAQYEVKELLKVLIKKKFISLDLLNNRIESFTYMESDVTDKPIIISTSTLNSSDHSIKQKGWSY